MTRPADRPLDRRVHAFRPDLAASSLRGRVESKRFVDGVPCRVRSGFTTLAEGPDFAARQASQLLHGELFTVYEEKDGWAWGQGGTDDYVGYLRVEGLDMEVTAPTHRITALRAYVFPEPDLKTPPLDMLTFEGRPTVTGEKDGWLELDGGGWIYARHAAPLDAGPPARDAAATALRFLGTPYLWGGRTSLGLDCSALVQLALAAAGIPTPRDSDLQRMDGPGQTMSLDGRDFAFARGDLVFFPGHVGIMADGTDLIHANAWHMEVVREPLAAVLDRAGAKGINGVRRPA